MKGGKLLCLALMVALSLSGCGKRGEVTETGGNRLFPGIRLQQGGRGTGSPSGSPADGGHLRKLGECGAGETV